jgi:hypothetical protein
VRAPNKRGLIGFGTGGAVVARTFSLYVASPCVYVASTRLGAGNEPESRFVFFILKKKKKRKESKRVSFRVSCKAEGGTRMCGMPASGMVRELAQPHACMKNLALSFSLIHLAS